jgi:hypothetical protein
VELRYRGLRSKDGTPLADTKLLHLDIANQRGKKNIPLHVGFVGSNTILNDGKTANKLTLRITNASRSELPLNPKSSPAASKFIISFDTDASWGLASRSEIANKMTIEAIDGENLDEADWDVQPGRQLGNDLAWTLTHKKSDAGLAAGQVIQVQLGNITSSFPSGGANLYLRYENIPRSIVVERVILISGAPIKRLSRKSSINRVEKRRERLRISSGLTIRSFNAWHALYGRRSRSQNRISCMKSVSGYSFGAIIWISTHAT